MFNKLLLCILVIMYSLIGMIHSCYSATNIALGKPYTITPLPNYLPTASPTDSLALTDGKYTTGFFWAEKTTVGWQQANNAEVLIDLGKVSIIGSIAFRTARGISAGVYFPAQISAYVGPDKEHLLFVGDIAKDPGNIPGGYQVRKFFLNDIDVRGRYVLLEIEPKGFYLFCDEIEVYAGDQEKGTTGTLSVNDVRNLSEELRRAPINRNILNGLIKKFESAKGAHSTLTDRITEIKKRIILLTSSKDAESIETDILKLRGEVLRSKFPGKQYVLESINPWEKISFILPLSGMPLVNLSLSPPRGGYDYVAFVITNLSTNLQQVFLSKVKLPEGAPDLSLYQVPFVKSAAMEYVADPLLPVKSGFILRAGESRIVMLRAYGGAPGVLQATLNVAVGKEMTSIPIVGRVLNTSVHNPTINSMNWADLDAKLIKNRKTAAMKDLFSHHTNVFVVNPTYGNEAEPIALNSLESYLNFYKGAARILFFMNFHPENRLTAGGKYKFMDRAWKEWFKKWYQEALKIAAKSGFPQEQIYLYPYDEMSGKDIDRFVELAMWAKKAIPGIKFYATLGNKESLRVIPLLDIAQIADRKELLENIGTVKTELWFYDFKGPAKSLSPYSYYRKMPWMAFSLGFKGVGFWAYADTVGGANPGTAWDDFDGIRPDYAVIYDGEGTSIISSRRWEAWRMGIEDYELLTMYAKAKGDAAAKALAKIVIDNPQNLSKADEVRRKILLELSR